MSYFERQLFYDKLDAELRAAQGDANVSTTTISPKVAPSKANSVVPECSLDKSDSAESTATKETQDQSKNESSKASESDSESDSGSIPSRNRHGTASDGQVVKPAEVTSKKSVEAPKKYGSFQRHNSKTNGFAFAHAEGGDMHQRSLSFIGIRHAVNAFDKSRSIVEIEEKVPEHHARVNALPHTLSCMSTYAPRTCKQIYRHFSTILTSPKNKCPRAGHRG